MKVKIKDAIYNSEETPILLILSDEEKKEISSMEKSNNKYIKYPRNSYTLKEIKNFSKIPKCPKCGDEMLKVSDSYVDRNGEPIYDETWECSKCCLTIPSGSNQAISSYEYWGNLLH